jgi:hypothetical protein
MGPGICSQMTKTLMITVWLGVNKSFPFLFNIFFLSFRFLFLLSVNLVPKKPPTKFRWVNIKSFQESQQFTINLFN